MATTESPVGEGAQAVTRPPAVAARSDYAGASLFREVTGELGFEPEPQPYPDGTFMAAEITPGGVAILDVHAGRGAKVHARVP